MLKLLNKLHKTFIKTDLLPERGKTTRPLNTDHINYPEFDSQDKEILHCTIMWSLCCCLQDLICPGKNPCCFAAPSCYCIYKETLSCLLKGTFYTSLIHKSPFPSYKLRCQVILLISLNLTPSPSPTSKKLTRVFFPLVCFLQL